jgi:acyl-CoA thioesterase I
MVMIIVLFPDVGYTKRTLSTAIKKEIKVVVMGDDLVNGQGLFAEDESFSVQLEKQNELEIKKKVLTVVTLAQDGGTTLSIVQLIPHVMAEEPDIVILVVGYNDAIARIDPDIIYNNLDTLLRELDRAGAYVMLVGVEAPYNAEHSYAERFNNIYPRLAQRYRVVYHNGFLTGVQGDTRYTQEDRYHPNRLGVERMVKNILPSTKMMIHTISRRFHCNANKVNRKYSFCKDYVQ